VPGLAGRVCAQASGPLSPPSSPSRWRPYALRHCLTGAAVPLLQGQDRPLLLEMLQGLVQDLNGVGGFDGGAPGNDVCVDEACKSQNSMTFVWFNWPAPIPLRGLAGPWGSTVALF
jgi:hypothetical protein